MVELIDRVGRTCIEYSLQRAAELAEDENTREWISTILDEDSELGITIVCELIGLGENKKSQEELEIRMQKLDTFRELVEEIYETYSAELCKIKGIGPI